MADYLMPGYVESYSLWLEPKGRLAERLQEQINSLSDTYGGPRFLPHVTLLPDIQQPKDQVVSTAEQLAQQLKKYHINFLNVTKGTFFFQCVFLLCAKDTATMDAAALARKLYDMPPTKPYMPHLSLLYADLEEDIKDQVVHATWQRIYGEGSSYETLLTEPGFDVQSISLWYTPTEDKSLQSWCKVAEFPLEQ